MRLMPCMYLTNLVLGRSGSGFFNVEIFGNLLEYTHKKLHRKDTAFVLRSLF